MTSTNGCEPVSASLRALLDRRVGYAASATGGADGCVYHVTNANDSGPGSLRQGATTGATWIVFDGDFTITLGSRLNLAKDTTIDGRGHAIVVDGEIYIPHSNVIVTNLVMNNYTGNELEDAIGIQGLDATNIWLDHISFDVTPDELLPLFAWPTTDYAPGNVTVTWSRFGAGGRSPSSTQTGSHGVMIGGKGYDGKTSSRTRLTLAYNLFETHMRAPSVADGGRAHVYNNLYTHWVVSGINVKRNGQVRSEHNIFAEDSSTRVRAYLVNESDLMGDEVMYDQGSWFPNGASGTQYRREAVFSVPYAYGLLPADATLMNRIQAAAGATLH